MISAAGRKMQWGKEAILRKKSPQSELFAHS